MASRSILEGKISKIPTFCLEKYWKDSMSARWLVKPEQRITYETHYVCFVIRLTRVSEASGIEKIRLL